MMSKGSFFFALLAGSVAATLAGREPVAETTIYHGDGTTTVVRGTPRPGTVVYEEGLPQVIDMPPSPRRGAAERARLARVVALTADRKYFVATNPPALTETDRRSARKSMESLLRDVRELLAHKTKPVVSSLYPAWGEIVAASADPASLGADRQSAVYMLSLMFAERFDEAEKLGRDILAAHPDDYGATVLLGFLAIRDQRNFPYLEKAFAAAPDFTPHLFEWQLLQLKIAPRGEWDFADAFYRMLGRHPEIDFSDDIRLQMRLKRGFFDKYGDYNDPAVCDALPEELQKAAAKLRQVRVIRFQRPNTMEGARP